MQWRGVRRLSVRPSVRLSVNFCANRFFSQANSRIVTKLAQEGLQVSVHPGCAQGQAQGQRSRNTGTFVLARKSLLLAGKWLERDQTCTRWSTGKPASTMCSRSRSRSKVTWYAHFLGFLEWATPSLTVWFRVVLPPCQWNNFKNRSIYDVATDKNCNVCSRCGPGNAHFISICQVSLPVDFRNYATY